MTMPRTVGDKVDALFIDTAIPKDIALHLLNVWIDNLETTESQINKSLITTVGIIIAFLTLDTGILTKIEFLGTDLQRTGLVLCIVPVAITFFYYRYVSLMTFAGSLCIAIAVLYKKLHDPIYRSGLDMLTHYPSIRNLESFDAAQPLSRIRFFYRITTEVVQDVLFFGPIIGLAYCLYRLRHYPDIGPILWWIITIFSVLFIIRAWTFGFRDLHDTNYRDRRRKPSSDKSSLPSDKEPVSSD